MQWLGIASLALRSTQPTNYNMNMKYRRFYQPGGMYFFTVVTYQRQRIFDHIAAINLFLGSIDHVNRNHPFETIAYCICPDHIHAIWKLPQNDLDYPARWRLIKTRFSRNWVQETSIPASPSRRRKHERTIWQRRYWEHIIQDERDLSRHIDYIHYNPVKHGLVQQPDQWEYSSFKEFVKNGFYSSDWTVQLNANFFDTNNIGNE